MNMKNSLCVCVSVYMFLCLTTYPSVLLQSVYLDNALSLFECPVSLLWVLMCDDDNDMTIIIIIIIIMNEYD